MDCSPPRSFVQGILQARILEWVAISFSRCRESVWGTLPVAKVMRKEARHTQRRDWASGDPLFPSIYPQNQSLPTLLLYALAYTSDFTEGYSPTTSLCKGVNLGLQIINLLGMARVSQVKPLCWQTSLCDRIIHTLATMYMIVYNLSTINSTESLEYFESLS